MLSDGLELLGTSTATNFSIASGSALPTTGDLNIGELFYFIGTGLMVYDGSSWQLIGNGTPGTGGPSGDFMQQFNSAISQTSINVLNDVQTESTNESNQIVMPRDGEVLAWSQAIQQWVPSDASVNVSSVNQLLGAVVLTTSEIPEPNVQNPPNMYWSATRGDEYLAQTSIKKLADVDDTMSPSPNDILKWNGSNWTSAVNSESPVQSVNGKIGAVQLTTSDIGEGSNAYWTDTRFNLSFSFKHLSDLFDVSMGSSPNGKYLMYSQPVDSQGNATGQGTWVTAAAPGAPVTKVNGKAGVVVLNADDIQQGTTNLYFTPGQFQQYFDPAFAAAFPNQHLSNLSDINHQATGEFLMKTSTGWSTAVPPTGLVTSVNTKTGDVVLNTTDIVENGTGGDDDKIFFSNTRFNTRFTAKHLGDLGDVHLTSPQVLDTILWNGTNWYNATIPSSSVISVAGRTGTITLTTDDVAEGSNLYWTQARFNAAYTAAYTNGTALSLKFSSLSDMKPYGMSNVGQYLMAYDNGDNTIKWGPGTPPTAPVTSVAGKTGAVTLTTDNVAEGNTNKYSTQASVTAYVNTLSIDAFNDVSIGTPSTGQVLKWNGVNWVNDVVSVSSAAIISGLGYTPANKAGDTIGSVVLSGGNVSAGQLTSTTTSGAAPLVVASSTVVANLNASYLNGSSNAYFANDYMTFAISDEVTAPTSGTNKITFRVPYAMTLYQIPRMSCSVAGSTITSVDILMNGTTILGTAKLTLDASEKTSVSAATPTTLAVTSIPDDAEITVTINSVGTGVLGLKITLYVKKT